MTDNHTSSNGWLLTVTQLESVADNVGHTHSVGAQYGAVWAWGYGLCMAW